MVISKKVTRYYSECGRGFWSKQKALTHSQNCKCWKNPKYKCCVSCKFQDFRTDTNGMEHEPQFLQIWQYNNCDKSDFGVPVHQDFDHIRKYCPYYIDKKEKA